MPHRRWFVQKTNDRYLRYLASTASVSEAFAQVLINRGIKTPEAVRAFLDPTLQRLEDPYEIPNLKRACEVISSAIKAGKRILVHGDYDTDGLTATAIMVSTISSLGGDVVYFIPDRFEHGYGFNPPGVEYATEAGASVIVTVDCGITSHETVKMAKERGISVVITDHHEPLRDREMMPIVPDEADAVVNPLLRKTDDPEPNISGATVAIKVAIALAGMGYSQELLDLACLGTVADLVPLIGDNRIIAKEGLRLINDSPRAGIRALKEVSSVKQLTAGLLSFTLIPRLNASGRIDNANRVIRLLLTDNYNEAIELAEYLSAMNTKRQRVEEEVMEEAVEMVRQKGYDRCIVVASEGWHEGVVGIVASRLTDMFYRPAFVFNIEGGIAKGSARSIPPFDLYRGLSGCRDLLIAFGGHKQAAGLRLKASDIEAFENRMNRIITEAVPEEELVPLLKIDASVRLRDVNLSLVNELARMEPFGYGNPEPLLGTKGIEAVNPRIVGKNHLKIFLKENSLILDAIGFDMGDSISLLEENSLVDAVYTPQINEWEGNKSLQLKLRAIRQTKDNSE